jgi:hypothetical protein
MKHLEKSINNKTLQLIDEPEGYTWYEGIATISQGEQYDLRLIDDQAKQILAIMIDSLFYWRAKPRKQDIIIRKYFSDCLVSPDHPEGHYTQFHHLEAGPSISDVISFFSDRSPREEAKRVVQKLSSDFFDSRIKSSAPILNFQAFLSLVEEGDFKNLDIMYLENSLSDHTSWLDIIFEAHLEQNPSTQLIKLGAEIQIKGAFRIPKSFHLASPTSTYFLECTQYCSLPDMNGLIITIDKTILAHDITDLIDENEAKKLSIDINTNQEKHIFNLSELPDANVKGDSTVHPSREPFLIMIKELIDLFQAINKVKTYSNSSIRNVITELNRKISTSKGKFISEPAPSLEARTLKKYLERTEADKPLFQQTRKPYILAINSIAHAITGQYKSNDPDLAKNMTDQIFELFDKFGVAQTIIKEDLCSALVEF